jgi:catecholate siderophore receptor
VLALLPFGALAESGSVLKGRVLDATRASITGARIGAVRSGRTSEILGTSDRDGEFSMPLEPGIYTIRVAADRFQAASRTITVPENGQATCEFILQIAGVHDSVTVTEKTDYQVAAISTATKTLTPLRDVPQTITVVSQEQMKDQMMMSIGDVVRYVPGITAIQGENNRDQLVIRGNSTSADFFVDGVRDDVQYYRDLYNLERVEALKGPNAMMFGRGGGGGVVNRVTKEAGFTPVREISLLGGSFGTKRFTADLDQPLGGRVALRLNALYENSDSFRKYVNLERHGIAPSLTIAASKQTKITLNYENFRDDRVADRGITSFQGKPADVDIATFYGNPKQSHVGARVNLGSAVIEHVVGRFTIRNRTTAGNYDRGYQNFVPGAVTADKTQVSLSAYNNATQRRNVFNQTDVTFQAQSGRLRHTVLAGVEFGRQLTDNFRNTGYFNNAATSILVPYANPVIDTTTTFRQSATDADNHLKTNIAAAYVQDQIDVSRHVQVVTGVRFDHFDLQFHNNRTGENLRRIDNLVSPRAGLVYKPATPVSVYVNYSVSYLPSSGDQFSSLTTVTQQVKPEKFDSYEAGVKWELSQNLAITTAVYRLDRTNTRSTDPNDPTRIVQTGSQRTNGFEAGISGSITRRWRIAGGYAFQDAFVTSATTAAKAGAQVGQVPHQTFSLWNNYQFVKRFGAGLGILNRTGMFAAIDNTVRLPGYTRVDAAAYYSLTEHMRLQANVENLLDRRYYVNADSNTNISPGFARTVRVGLIARF